MFSLNIVDVKGFMQKLFKEEIFDCFEVRQVEIMTFTKFSINCTINKDYLNNDELELLDSNYVTWNQLKPYIINIIKGNRQPSHMKIALACPPVITNIDDDNIESLLVNIIYENNKIACRTGTSLKNFTLDKSTDLLWDDYFSSFLKDNHIFVSTLTM